MSSAASRPPAVPPAWFVHTAWRVHRALHRITGGRTLWTPSNRRGWGALRLTTAVVRLAHQSPRPARARACTGAERDRLWQRWAAVEPRLEALAGLRSTETPVVVLEPCDGSG